MCSTPEGIEAAISARVPARVRVQSRWCSTPEGIEAAIRQDRAAWRPGALVVLNARRHRGGDQTPPHFSCYSDKLHGSLASMYPSANRGEFGWAGSASKP